MLVALVSNTEALLTNVDINRLGIRDRFSVVTLSSDFGAEKPDRSILDATLDLIGDVEAAAMVGDSWDTDIEGALAAGIAGVYLEPGLARGTATETSTSSVVAAAPDERAILRALGCVGVL